VNPSSDNDVFSRHLDLLASSDIGHNIVHFRWHFATSPILIFEQHLPPATLLRQFVCLCTFSVASIKSIFVIAWIRCIIFLGGEEGVEVGDLAPKYNQQSAECWPQHIFAKNIWGLRTLWTTSESDGYVQLGLCNKSNAEDWCQEQCPFRSLFNVVSFLVVEVNNMERIVDIRVIWFCVN